MEVNAIGGLECTGAGRRVDARDGLRLCIEHLENSGVIYYPMLLQENKFRNSRLGFEFFPALTPFFK